ncbi:MAG: hypothetical protein Q8P54_01285 [bacterium]|nr:hypothetical protein [bacterium]
MRDVKSEQNLAGDEHWPFIPVVTIKGDELAKAIPEGANQTQGEKVVQSWQKVAVLEVNPDIEVYFGFIAGRHMQFLNVAVRKKQGQFGVRVGDGKVSFFVIPKDLQSRPSLKLITVTTTQDKAYADLPLY